MFEQIAGPAQVAQGIFKQFALFCFELLNAFFDGAFCNHTIYEYTLALADPMHYLTEFTQRF